jgi:hypothetical protein
LSAITTTSTFHKDLIVVDHSRLDGMSQGELVELAKDINGKAIKAAKQTLIHAGQTGIVLIALKAKIPHGQFLKYVEHLTEIPARTAQTYMSIATNYATVAHLRGVRDAIRYIRESSGRANRLTAIESLPSPAPRPSPVPVILDAEIVEPLTEKESARLAELESRIESCISKAPAMFKDPTPGHDDDPIDPHEPLLVAIKEGNPDANPDPIYHAVERLIFVLISHNCSAGYIHSLSDAVNKIEGRLP